MPVHPREALLGAQAGAVVLPVCDHYSGVEARMKKSLTLQAEMAEEFGISGAALSRMLALSILGPPKPQLRQRARLGASNVWYDPLEMRAWWRRKVEAEK